MAKYPRTYHLPFSYGSNDDKKSKSVDKLLNTEIIITEKLDGENCCLTKSGVYARSHIMPTNSPWSSEVRQIYQKLIFCLEDDIYLYGENMEGIHSIEYNKLTSYFYLFAVKDGENWLSWSDVIEYSMYLDLAVVPVLFEGIVRSEKELENLISILVKTPSVMGGEKEGVVVRVRDGFDQSEFTQKVMKWVRPNHVQTNAHWTKNWKKATINC